MRGQAEMRVWQAGSHLTDERGARVEDWSWRQTRRRIGDAPPPRAPVQGSNGARARHAPRATRWSRSFRRTSSSSPSTTGSRRAISTRSPIVVAAFVVAGIAAFALSAAQTYFTGWVGRAGARRPAHPALRPPAAALARLLRAQPHRRDHQPDHERRRGARPARHRRRSRASSRTRSSSSAPRSSSSCSTGGSRSRRSSSSRSWRSRRRWFRSRSNRAYRRVRERLGLVTATLAEDISGMRVVQSFTREPTSQAHLPRRQRALPRGELRDGRPQRPLLPGRRHPLVGRDRDRARLGGCARRRRQRHDRHAARLHALPRELLRPRAAALAALQHVPLGDRGARQDHRRARRGARGRRRAGCARARPRSTVTSASRTSASATATCRRCCTGSTSTCPPGRPSRSSATPAPGKSTIAKLLARFYDPRDGRITIDGTRPARRHAGVAAAPARHRAAGGLPLRRHGRRQHRLRPPGAHPGRRSQRRQRPSARTTSSRELDGRLRHRARRARLPALARPAAARRVRARAARRPAHPDPRRGDVVGRHRHRADDRARRCGASSPGRPRSSSRTGSRRSGAPT